MRNVEYANKNFKTSGEIEVCGVEPLPPTEISPKAFKKLLKWGVPEDLILEIQLFSSSFRYDHCDQKIARLCNLPLLITQNDTDEEFVTFPSFYDVKGRLDGQCGDIARQFIMQANFSGLLDEIQLTSTLKKNCRVVSTYNTGRSKTHFCKVGDNHVWNGLALFDTKKNETLDEIYIDAAFQKIITKKESGYTQNSQVTNASAIEAGIQQEVAVGWVDINGTLWQGKLINTAILGVSNDRNYAYGLGFLRRKNAQNELVPIISRIHPNGKSDLFCINPDNGWFLKSTLIGELSNEQSEEIHQLLQKCATFTYTDDTSLYPNISKHTFSVSWR